MSEIRAALDELNGVAQEMYNLRKRLKELQQRKRELDSVVIEYLDSNDKKGLRVENIVFVATEKNTRSRVNKSEAINNGVNVLNRYGIQNNAREILEELEATRKGPVSSVPVLRMKPAQLFN